MQSDQKIGLSLLIALTGFGLALGFGRRESPAQQLIEQAELSSVGEAFVEPPVATRPLEASPRPTLAAPGERPTPVVSQSEPVVEQRSLSLTVTPTAEPAPTPVEPATSAPRRLVKPQPQATPPPAVRLRPYVIRSGDTLSGIAARELGDSSRYDEIFRANEKRLGNPDAIRVGQTIGLPAR